MTNEEKEEIRHLAWQLKQRIESSQWYKEFYEKAMTERGNNTYTEDPNRNDDIVFDFNTMELETFPQYEQNQSNIVIKYGFQLDEEREARQRRLAKEEADKVENK